MAEENIAVKSLLSHPLARHIISIAVTLILAYLAKQGIEPAPLLKEEVQKMVSYEVDTKVGPKVDEHLNEVLFGKIPVGAKPECNCECNK